jgi:predicted nucleic acid-binding protein
VNSDRVCVDASLALTWLLSVQSEERADTLRRQWLKDDVELLGPPLFHAEVTSVLREEVFFKRLTREEGEEAFSLYSVIPIRIVNSPAIYRKAWELAVKYNQHRTYDMQYLAVAEIEDCEFWTLDRKIVNTLRGKNQRIKWVGDYDQQ